MQKNKGKYSDWEQTNTAWYSNFLSLVRTFDCINLETLYVNCIFVTFKEQLLSQETQSISPNCGTITHWIPSRANSRILPPWICTWFKWWPFFELLHCKVKVCTGISEEYTASIFSDNLVQVDTEIIERKGMC